MNPTQAYQPAADANGSSAPPSAMSGPEDSRVLQAVEEYLAALEAGCPPRREEFLRQHAGIAARLGEYLDGLELIHRAASSRPASSHGEVPAAEDLAGGEPLGDFLLLREIGRGGMGVVYEAVQRSLNRRVALKVLPFAAALDARQLQRFKNEAQAAASLHHTNIVPVYFVGCERGVHFYAMQLIEGQTLSQVIAELRRQASTLAVGVQPADQGSDDVPTGPYTPTTPIAGLSTAGSANTPAFFQTVARLGIQAAEALEHAHQLGVVHRDIKPGNLMVDGTGRMWVTDFGLAQFQSDTKLTMTGDLLGTLRYMSPEQALAQRIVVDHRTDIYSLGVTLYELLTLRPAIEGNDRQELLRKIAFEEPTSPRRWNPAMPADLETILLKAIGKSPEERYATAQELADDLRRFLEDKLIRARRPSLTQRVAKWARRHQSLVAASAVTGLVALTTLAASTLMIWRAKGQAERERARAEQNLNVAVHALNSYMSDLIDAPSLKARGMEPLRRELLLKARDYFEQLLAGSQPTDNHTVMADWGSTHLRLGLINVQLGNRSEAIAYFQQAAGILGQLTRENPNVPTYRLELAKCCINLGLTYDTTQLGEAEASFQRAMALDEELVRDHPAVAEYQYHLAGACLNLGRLYQDTNRGSQAAALYRKTIAILDRLTRDCPDAPDYRGLQGLACMNLANLASIAGERAEAETGHEKAIAIFERLVQDYPGVPGYQKDLAGSYHNLAHWYDETDRPTQAEPIYRKSLAVRERLSREHPSVPEYQRLLAETHSHLGINYQAIGRPAEAAAAYQKAIDILEPLVTSFPDDFSLPLGGVYSNRGSLVREQQPEASLEWYTKAIRVLERARQGRPQDGNVQRYIEITYRGRAEAMAKLGRHKEAVSDWDRAVELTTGQDRLGRRYQRCWSLVRAGEYERTASEVKEIAEGLTGPASLGANDLYNLACLYALCSAAAEKDEKLPQAEWSRRAEGYADRAMALLGQAVAKGFQSVADLKKDANLDRLRARADFQNLLQEVEAKAPSVRR